MMQAIRDSAKGWIGWVIVVIIIVPFALWGVHEYAQRQATVAVATVNGAEITERELQNAYLQQRQRLQAMLGEHFRPELIDEQQLRRETLEQMIERRVLMEALRDARFRTADAQIAAQIRGFDVFWENGAFSPERYRQFLASQRLTPEQFEEQLRGDVLLEQFYAGVAATAFSTPHEFQTFMRLQEQQRDIGYAVVPVERFRDQVQVTDDEVEAHYQANQRRYVTQERVRLAYLELSIDDVARGVEVSEEAVRAFYEERAEQFGGEERRAARHILLLSGDEPGQALEQAEGLRERILAGEDFAELAREYSQDPGSAQAGGDLGSFARGDMVPGFERAAFALDEGEVSEPVETEFGVHLIQVTAIERPRAPSYEELRDELRAELQRRRAEMRFRDVGERLANLTYEQPDTLDEAAEQLGLTVQETDWITRDGGDAGIAQDRRVVQAAFSDDVLAQGYNSEPIEVEPQRVVVVRVAEHEPAAALPLDDVRERIVEALRSQKAREEARALAQGMLERAQAGEDPAEVAAAEGLGWERAEGVTRHEAGVPAGVVRRAFTLPRPTEGEPSVAMTHADNGDPVVLGVYRVQDGDVADAEQRADVQDALASEHGNRLFRAVVESLKAQAEIRRHAQEDDR
ncbi:SurA N-terminal domain-containing protein [Ectothiorhodospiraceae bacterium 2226]|nr:SurA N-terminal domain-containing protein [Ectothiorhodospiraceae bacterium 2226]